MPTDPDAADQRHLLRFAFGLPPGNPVARPVRPEFLAGDGAIEAVRVPLPSVLPDQVEPSFARPPVTTDWSCVIRLENVSKRFGQAVAVHDLSLHVRPGELFACLGPNGAGKTTTIKMLCGLLKPSGGRVSVGGFDLQTHGDEARQLISYVPDQPFVYDKLTGREFLEFIAELYGMERSQATRRMDEVIATFHLGEFVDDLTERYSHGMRQRTVFASALLHEPKLLIADEPTVGLDPRSIRELKMLLRQLADSGTTVFLSTHTLDIAQELADRIGIIHRGRLIGCGTLDELRAKAAHDGSLEEVFLRITEPAA